jgi:cation:H+ antiporter
MSHLSVILEFIFFGAITWIAGIWLTRTTSAIDSKYKLGSAFGGLLILGFTTSLPEIAIAFSAALEHHYDIIIGTLIGGIAIQTVVLCLLDARMKVRNPLTFSAASLTLVLEAAIVILVSVASIVAIKTPLVVPHTSISLASVFIFGLWFFGLWLIFKARNGLPWRAEAIAANPGREHHERRQIINHPVLKKMTTKKIFLILGLSALATLIAGFGLQVTGSHLATDFNINSGLFAATFIALAGALPNISTGLSSIKIGDYKLAMSDEFGGNAIMPALFIFCDLIARKPVLSNASASDIWFAGLGVLLTAIYIIGLIMRPKRNYLGMGLDSLAVLIIYIIGIIAISVAKV